MTRETLNEREFELINIIGAELASSQRDLSSKIAMSLGTTNILLRRLVSKGYIRIQQLNKQKVQYILTPKGIAEKTRKSIKYTIKTINSIGLIRKRLKEVILKLYKEGERVFFILGESDLVILVESTFKENKLDDCTIMRLKQPVDGKVEGTVLICTEEVNSSMHEFTSCVDLIEKLSEAQELIYMNNHHEDLIESG